MYGFKFLINRLRRDNMRRSYTHIVCQQFKRFQFTQIRSYSRRIVNRQIETSAADDNSNWARKIFSGIQPTGALHLGNYLGAVRKWKELQDAQEDVTYCIVDMHSITLPQESVTLRENIFQLAATMLACGINPNKSTIFVQSAVKEHSELCWLIGTLCTMARLGHLPQYKDKTQQMREIPLGLFIYPILQAADILLYKTTHVPVGEDQVQHIQLTQHLARVFNSRFGLTFPICHAIIDDKQVSRIRSLRDPSKKMSKSDPNPKSVIYVTDEPDVVVEKVKKAITDFCSDVSYEPEGRPGVSNLIAIHSHISGQPIEQVVNEARTLDTGKYKLRVAEAINEHLKPIRQQIQHHLDNRSELVNMLDVGAEKARNVAFDTVEEVKHKMGLGAPYLPLYLDTMKSVGENIEQELDKKQDVGQSNATATATAAALLGVTVTPMRRTNMLEQKLATLEVSPKFTTTIKPEVPQQRLRIEKQVEKRKTPATGRPINIIGDITKGLLNKGLLQQNCGVAKNDENDKTSEFLEPKIRRIARCVEVKPPATIVAPAVSTQTIACDMSNQRNRVIGNMLITTTTTTTTANPNPLNLPSTSPALSIPKTTTLPAAWPGAKKNSNVEVSVDLAQTGKKVKI